MRMSCNGCRVLRKGCSEGCSIRPCLQWIKSPESQANATVFLAKFYGRAGLLNLINAGPDNLRPSIFRSLLYEACGRIVNPVYGSVGLLWSGSWQLCQAAVEAVLKGTPIVQMPCEAAAAAAATPTPPPFKAYDIRHVSKPPGADLHNTAKTRTRFKRCGAAKQAAPKSLERDLGWVQYDGVEFRRDKSLEASRDGDSRQNESMFSGETMEASHVSQAEANSKMEVGVEQDDVGLELTLGLEPFARRTPPSPPAAGEAQCELGLDLVA